MMVKRGRTPSLIGSTHGTVRFAFTGRKSECRRCNEEMSNGTFCIRVSKPGTMGPGRAYCASCFGEVLDQTQRKLDDLRVKLRSAT